MYIKRETRLIEGSEKKGGYNIYLIGIITNWFKDMYKLTVAKMFSFQLVPNDSVKMFTITTVIAQSSLLPQEQRGWWAVRHMGRPSRQDGAHSTGSTLRLVILIQFYDRLWLKTFCSLFLLFKMINKDGLYFNSCCYFLPQCCAMQIDFSLL